ncbi:hypothetical protein ACHAXT_011567 [Thalassiosira profunda]
MAPRAKRRAANGARRRTTLRRVSANDRWLHLSAGDIDVRDTLQTIWGWTSIAASFSALLLALAVVVEDVAGPGADMAAIEEMIELFGISTISCMSLLEVWTALDTALFDITPEEEAQPRQFTRKKDLRIDDLSDPAAHKMTHFYHGQLRRLYTLFDLDGHLAALNEEKVPLYTGHYSGNTPCRYLIHPEELFLFTLCKIATGGTNQSIVDEYFGGDYARWSFGYRWMLRYLDDRYKDIIGHQGLSRFVGDFPRFHKAIERFVQRERVVERLDGSYDIIPGLEYLPWDIFGFIDDQDSQSCVPFSGPRGDYEGAARRVEYADAQQSVYSGYKKFHGLGMETVFLPNGISTVFGPVSCRRGDAAVLAMSNLNPFLCFIQHGLFFAGAGMAVYYGVFGDTAFNLGMECVQSYFRAYGAGAQLTDAQKKCNGAVKAARITIEKNYAMKANLFRICNSKEGLKLAKKNPYALEQLRVCHLLVNCYVCLNGDQASSINTFGVSPPKLEDYLEL